MDLNLLFCSGVEKLPTVLSEKTESAAFFFQSNCDFVSDGSERYMEKFKKLLDRSEAFAYNRKGPPK